MRRVLLEHRFPISSIITSWFVKEGAHPTYSQHYNHAVRMTKLGKRESEEMNAASMGTGSLNLR